MATDKIRKLGREPSRDDLQAVGKARLILKYSHDTAESQLEAFGILRKGKRGAPTDEQQDLLRAMLVFAGAGLDSSMKQLVEDALPELCAKDVTAANAWEAFVQRHVRADLDKGSGRKTPGFIARALLAEDRKTFMLDAYVRDLTGSSLQSFDELTRVCRALGVDAKTAGVVEADLKPIFSARNQIIHELDIDFGAVNRNRFARKRKDMVDYSNQLFKVGESIVDSVERRLGA